MITIFMLVLSFSLCYSAQDSTIKVELTREDVIDQAITNFPEIQEGIMLLNSVGFNYEKFAEFLDKRLATDIQEANIGELHCQATDDVISKIVDIFLQDLYVLLTREYELQQSLTSKSIVYCNKYRNLPVVQHSIKMVLDKPYKLEEPALHLAVIKRNKKIVDYLLTWNVDVNLLYKDWTPLARACRYGDCDIAKSLIDAGAIVDSKIHTKKIPLFVAIQNRHEEIVFLLLAQGADVNRYNREFNVLRYAMLHVRNLVGQNIHAPHIPILKILLSAENINLNAICFGSTALHYAAKNNDLEIVSMLLDAGADATILDDIGQTADQIATSPAVQRLFVQVPTQQPISACCSIS